MEENRITVIRDENLLMLSNYLCNFNRVKKNSPELFEICMECSGILLDEENDLEVLSWPQKKFFSYNESAIHVDKKPFEAGVHVYEKLNGISCTLYHYKGSWRVASSSSMCFLKTS